MYTNISSDEIQPVEEQREDIIHPDQAGSIFGLFSERVRRSPGHCAYRQYDSQTEQWLDFSWQEIANQVVLWHTALTAEGLKPGDRVAICLRNCSEWVIFEIAAHSLGLITVPIYTNDRPDNMAYVLEDSGTQLLLVEHQKQWQGIIDTRKKLPELKRVLCLSAKEDCDDERLRAVSHWLPGSGELVDHAGNPGSLASLVYTSGTTGRPKGVMLSHYNMIWDAWAGLQHIKVYPDDVALSFLPLSHTLERTIGYYLTMMAGATVAFNRSIPELGEDMKSIRPTIMISVPRIFDRIYMRIQDGLKEKPAPLRWLFKAGVAIGWTRFERLQGRSQSFWWKPFWPLFEKLFASRIRNAFGGRLRFAISGGAPLSYPIAKVFIAFGINIQQGYGLTETSPVICVNTLEDNRPETVGTVFRDVEVRIGEDDELQIRSPGVMMGYWNNHTATYQTIDTDGWLHSGDKARIDPDGHISITGRIKEVIVLANGEKVPPADLEMALAADPLFDQVMIIGEGHSFLAALIVLNKPQHSALAAHHKELAQLEPGSTEFKEYLLQRIFPLLHDFPGYMQVFGVAVVDECWTVENELMTPTLKLKRHAIIARHAAEVNEIYQGHDALD
ncbi:MAG: AMP-dependent synthetase/ligase [Pseudomonadota bacterium]|nr:AMP-dependent synthetase/ligase [Pseudomonadota bacterium]